MGKKQYTRGMRNNNPLNIRIGNEWMGEVRNPTDREFEQFEAPVWGVRAAMKLIKRYINRYGLNTLTDIINRWAPRNENDTNNYITFVSRVSGILPNERLRWEDERKMFAIIKAMAVIESDWMLDDELLEEAYRMA